KEAAQSPSGMRARELSGAFIDIVEPLRQEAGTRSVLELLESVLERSGYARYLQDGTEEGEERLANVEELRSKAANYDELAPENALASFVEDVTLVQYVDQMDEGGRGVAVTLITLHAAKRREFRYVVLLGV